MARARSLLAVLAAAAAAVAVALLAPAAAVGSDPALDFAPPSPGVGSAPALDLAPPPPAASPLGPVSPPDVAAAARRTPTGCRRGGPPFRTNGPRDHKVVALTFDDGPSPYTVQVIRILVRERAKGTFFVLGNQIPGYERQLQRELAYGFEIGDHSFSHPQFPSSAQLSRTRDRIRRATGFTPCLFRPPYGAVDSALIGRARALGMMTINWDVDPRDWSTPGAGAIYSRVVSATRPGSIILMHEGGGPRGQTVAALPGIIRTLRARGYRFATVSELLGHKFVY
jgi:peptidoglycan/xylan/chitin deacetylase (PgdA/CDA1 family)